ncbi:VOC family protein [Arthrobacter nitrophenolicus]|uniref:Enzyme related to lactoylglutathione lyase n=1 Tax=Arthrobacter nitrophenolicus TaxID=683150 RepID=A0ACC6T9X3_9MICC|nr:VOC family protein [Arthrobacter nitrophenolicus]
MGGVVHFEIPADDQERAKKFYQEALGWRIDPVPGMDYNMVLTTPMDESTGAPLEPGAINGGMFARDPDLKTPVITVDVADINATLKTVESLGGAVVKPRETIPGMGSFAYFKDTEGNVMGLWENLPADGAGQAPDATGDAAPA